MNIFYTKICKLYSFVFSIFDNFFFLNSLNIDIVNKANQLILNGYCKEKLNKNFNNFDKGNNQIVVNKYMIKFLIDKDKLINLIKEIFIDSNLKNIISNKTGMNYSIDYFISYKTAPIEADEKDGSWYANHWHYDKPFSKNTLKVIIPLKKIENEAHGGIVLLSKKNSKNFDFNTPPDYQMIADTNEALIFYPNLCLHKAGFISEKNYHREQIMFQLNPARKWKVNNSIAKKQEKVEPKFPFFSYFFDNYSKFI